MALAAEERLDSLGEDEHSPVPGLVHRYPDRVLFLVTDRCAAYCRYCTRSRLVSNAQDYNFHPEYEQGLRYIEAHPEIRDVLLSGGDPLLLSDKKLDHLLSRLREIKHVEFIRIGSRIPVFLPQRITPELCEIFKKHGPIWMSIHVNHPKECTAELRDACERLSFAGVPLGTREQRVLPKGVNDDADVMKALVHPPAGDARGVITSTRWTLTGGRALQGRCPQRHRDHLRSAATRPATRFPTNTSSTPPAAAARCRSTLD